MCPHPRKGVYTLAHGPTSPRVIEHPTGPYHFIIGPVVCHRKDSLAPTGDIVQIKQHCHVAVRQGVLLSRSSTVDIPTCGQDTQGPQGQARIAKTSPALFPTESLSLCGQDHRCT